MLKKITKRIRVKTKQYREINFNSIEKKNKLEKENITVINCLSDESTLTSKSDIDEVPNIHSDKKWIKNFKEEIVYWWYKTLEKVSRSTFEILLFSEFYLYIGERNFLLPLCYWILFQYASILTQTISIMIEMPQYLNFL